MTEKPQTGPAPSGWMSALTERPYLLLVLAPLMWGGNIVVGKLAVGNIEPLLLVLGRWLGATLILIPFALPHLKRDWPQIKAGWVQLAIYGVLGFATFNALVYGAAIFTSSANISIEQAGIPVFVFIGNFLFFRVRARLVQLLGLVSTFVGVAWVATHGEPQRLVNLDINVGDGMVIAAVAAYAIYSLLLKYKPAIHWLSFMLVTAAFALVASIVFIVIFGNGLGELGSGVAAITPLGWLLVGYVMIFPSIVAQLSYARGVELVGPNRASIFINLLPIFGTLLSVAIVGEILQPFHLVAAALVLGGILLSEYAVRRHP